MEQQRFIYRSRHILLVVVVLNLIVFSLAIFSLAASWKGYRDKANIMTRNLALAIEQETTLTFSAIDRSLRALAENFAAQHGSTKNWTDTWTAMLVTQYQQMPMVLGLHTLDANGKILDEGADFSREDVDGTNTESDKSIMPDIYKQSFFLTHRSKESGLNISEPILGHKTQQWMIVLSRRLNDASGHFAGVVLATLPLSHFNKNLQPFHFGPKDSVTLRDADLALRFRQPEFNGNPQYGSKRTSENFRKMLSVAPTAGSYSLGTESVDGTPRFHSYKRSTDYPLYINVGISTDEYMGPWRTQALCTALLLLLFLIANVALVRYLLRSEKTCFQQRKLGASQRHANGLDSRTEDNVADTITGSKASDFTASNISNANSYTFGGLINFPLDVQILEPVNFQNIAESSPFGILIIEADCHFSYINPALTHILGYTLADIPHLDAWWHRAYPNRCYRDVAKSAWNDDVMKNEHAGGIGKRSFRVCSRDGVMHDILFYAVMLKNKRTILYINDITQQVQTEDELRSHRYYLEALVGKDEVRINDTITTSLRFQP